jgi:hypothetical protein
MALKGNRCQSCGLLAEQAPITVFEFHHVNGTDKVLELSRSKNIEMLLAEVEKTILLCANCHRTQHYIDDTVKTFGLPFLTEEAQTWLVGLDKTNRLM